jgi:DNA-directed RNA polymerase subunit F
MMKKPSNKSSFSVAAMKALLEQYACPLPFYQLRARLMGNIATPDMTASPMQEIKRIWNNELPVFDSKSEAEEFFGVLFQGLWNALSAHQKRTDPFKLARIATAPAGLEFLSRFARVRREEIEGFVDGLFANEDELDLPDSAHKAVGILGEMRSIFAATEQLTSQPASVASITETIKHFQQMSRIAEHEINVVIQSCKKARARTMETLPTGRPPVFH